jgi:hypothetical protein
VFDWIRDETLRGVKGMGGGKSDTKFPDAVQYGTSSHLGKGGYLSDCTLGTYYYTTVSPVKNNIILAAQKTLLAEAAVRAIPQAPSEG